MEIVKTILFIIDLLGIMILAFSTSVIRNENTKWYSPHVIISTLLVLTISFILCYIE